MLSRLYRYFTPYWKHLAASLFFVLLYAFTSGLLLYLSSTLLTSIFHPQSLQAQISEPSVLNPVGSDLFAGIKRSASLYFQNLLFSGSPESNLLHLCLALVAVVVAKSAFFMLQGFFAAYAEQGITKNLRDEIYAHIQKLSLQYFHRNRTGNLISTAINDVFKIQDTLNNTINNLIRDPLLILIYLSIMIIVSWKLTLYTVAIMPVVIYLIFLVGRISRRYSAAAQSALADISTSLEETINNVRIVRAYAAESSEVKRFMNRTSEYFRTMLKLNRTRLLPSPINEVLIVLAMAVIIWLIGTQVLHNQYFGFQDFTLYAFCMMAFIAPAKSVSNVHVRINEGLAAARRIFDLLDTQPKVVEATKPVRVERFKHEVEFDNVSFRYDTGDIVLEDISFSVRKGQIVALVGPSGSGKSTLVDLVCRFHDPLTGIIKIDGLDLREISFSSLRGLMGVVTQETQLFNDTVAKNIAYPLPNFDLEKVKQAALAANAHEFITGMPKGYETEIGNRGMMVSGGERQRLAIARALMKDPEILIFDEATSALDTESERLVQEAIDHLMAGRTTLVIAHRLSTILHADLILVLKHGRIVERGKHEELLRFNGVYRRLYDIQFERVNALEPGTPVARSGDSSEAGRNPV